MRSRLLSPLLLFTYASIASGGITEYFLLFADQLSPQLHDNTNDCTSCLGISMCFGLVYPGATGETKAEISDALHLPDISSELVWQQTADGLTSTYDGACIGESYDGGPCTKKATVEIANSVWIDVEASLKPEYEELVEEHLHQIAFGEEDAGGRINDWIANATNGLITDVLEEGPIRATLVAVNAIYLNATWTSPFAEEHTSQDIFYSSVTRDAEAIKSHFMHQVESFPYSHEAVPGVQLLQLPYYSPGSNGGLSMLVALPNAKATTAVTSAAVLKALPELKTKRVALALPKFKFKSRYKESLKTALEGLGVKRAFTDTAQFDGLVKDEELMVGDIIHETYINLYEKGTEAAAVTAIMMRTTSVMEPEAVYSMVVDHPFQFFIYDAEQALVLFEGRVGAPDVPADSVATLNVKHSDTFWVDTFRVETLAYSAAPSCVRGAGLSAVVGVVLGLAAAVCY